MIDNLRGLAMLGVIAIHGGSYVMELGGPRELYYLLTQVLSRYSVPMFFFISGYGLFTVNSAEKPLAYGSFIKTRLQSVAVPYLTWSLLYLEYSELMDGSVWFRDWGSVLYKILLGDSWYHLYFMVLLLAFYITLPLWRQLVRLLNRGPVAMTLGLVALAATQLWLFRWNDTFWSYPGWMKAYPVLIDVLNFRMNYLPFLYGFIFVMGALVAEHREAFVELLRKYFWGAIALWLAAAGLMVHRFYALQAGGMKLIQVQEYLHQLTPEGLAYTVACTLAFCALLDKYREARWETGLKLLSDHSFFLYLAHPFILDFWYGLLPNIGISLENLPFPLFYLAVVGTTLAASLCYQAWQRKHTGPRADWLNYLLFGKGRRKS